MATTDAKRQHHHNNSALEYWVQQVSKLTKENNALQSKIDITTKELDKLQKLNQDYKQTIDEQEEKHNTTQSENKSKELELEVIYLKNTLLADENTELTGKLNDSLSKTIHFAEKTNDLERQIMILHKQMKEYNLLLKQKDRECKQLKKIKNKRMQTFKFENEELKKKLRISFNFSESLQKQLVTKDEQIQKHLVILSETEQYVKNMRNRFDELNTKQKQKLNELLHTKQKQRQEINTYAQNMKKKLEESEQFERFPMLKANAIRAQNLEKNKNQLTFLTVIISVCSFIGSLFLSRSFNTDRMINGSIAIITACIALIIGSVKFYISYRTFKRHLSDDDGLIDLKEKINKNWTGYLLIMKAISMSIATLNDCTFDLFQGIAALTDEKYTASLLIILKIATWCGVAEESFELVVEIFFTANDFECCAAIWYNTAFLIWSVIESGVGIYLLTRYNTIELIVSGIISESVIVISCVLAFVGFIKLHKSDKNPGDPDGSISVSKSAHDSHIQMETSHAQSK
eukprot:405689_1